MPYRSLIAYIICALAIFYTAFIYYPKWKGPGTEATISWDVSGYYYYLPAIFIYKDVKNLGFKDSIEAKYTPAGSFYQAYKHRSGNYIMKYSCGQAVMYSPFFFAAHLYALNSQYPADGFSTPYQLGIYIGNFLVALLGLWYLRRVLLLYFKDNTVAITLILTVLATNYLNYASIDGAMTHNYLFTLYAILIFKTIQFYNTPSVGRGLFIGFLIGLAALTRPTEIIACLIPLLWGVNGFKDIKSRMDFIFKNKTPYIAAVMVCIAVGSLQLLYWKYAGGEFFIYSYVDQTFSWLRPHIRDCLISYRAGWLVYTPVMIFALIGFYFLKRYPPSVETEKKGVFLPTLVFSLLFMYIAFAWDIWWYGGSLGQRSMVQCYPILAFPLSAFVDYITRKNWTKWVFFPIFALFITYNIWLEHASHHGGGYVAGNMTGAYFWKILFKTKDQISPETVKLLDTREAYFGERKDVKQVYKRTFTADTSAAIFVDTVYHRTYLKLTDKKPYSPEYPFNITKNDGKWVRVSATFRCAQTEWDVWKMSQMILRFYNGKKIVREGVLRAHRFLKDGDTKVLYLDATIPSKTYDKVEVHFWNGGTDKYLLIEDITVEAFNGR